MGKKESAIFNSLLILSSIIFCLVIASEFYISYNTRTEQKSNKHIVTSSVFKTSMNSSYNTTSYYRNNRLVWVLVTSVSVDYGGILYPHFMLKDLTKSICKTDYQASTGIITINKAELPVSINCQPGMDYPTLSIEVNDAWARIYLLIVLNSKEVISFSYQDYQMIVNKEGYQAAVDELMAGFYSK